MKREPTIRIYWENPPGPRSGAIVERVTRSGIYQRRVPPRGLLSSTETARALGVTLRHLYNLVKDGKLKPIRKDDRLHFRLSDVRKQWSQARARAKGSEPWLTG